MTPRKSSFDYPAPTAHTALTSDDTALPKVFDVPILQECLVLMYSGAEVIRFPRTRLGEFLAAGEINRFWTIAEREKFRQRCLDGEGRAFGIRVEFEL